ncbi:MAG: aminopeptidase P N-terminal domain-containing protein [Mogibacterium sp.]|nr:aminopeptidase P N-terminal domain-containing protein [Mogibacterium sp.]
MEASFYKGNREKLYEMLPEGSLLAVFSGKEIIKTNDEYYPFFADRNFVYLTGLECREAILLAGKDYNGWIYEALYILPPDAHAERWTGVRIKPAEAEEISGVTDIRSTDSFRADFRRMAMSGNYRRIYLDFFKLNDKELDRQSHVFMHYVHENYPYILFGNADPFLRKLRLIKQPCEIEALRIGEKITGEGIIAMMKASRPGMNVHQYKAEFDRAIHEYAPYIYGFPPIISAGQDNFIIHNYAYTGVAQDGDMILNDVGVNWDHMITDVSRGWPCNGHFSYRQKILYECALATSDYMFSIIKPGLRMDAVDSTIKRYNAELLKDAGVLDDVKNIRKYMWHGGAHHIGFDVHDVVETPEFIAPGMVFCIDVGIYHEEWGIGFRVEDNCLVTEDGCENLSACIPRTVEDIEAVMNN